MAREEQRKAFGLFVRAKREALQPTTETNRRPRTPGMRREELALRAGISTTWCAWIEQGRSAGISGNVLNRLAHALDLNEEDRKTFFELAEREDPRFFPTQPPARVPAWIASMIHDMSNPAFVLDAGWTAIGANAAAQARFPGWLGDDCDHNLLRYAFLNKEPRSLFADWRTWAAWLVADFRDQAASRRDTGPLRELIVQLSQASTTFAALWNEEAEVGPAQNLWSIRNQEGGVETYVASRLQGPSFGQSIVSALIPLGTAALADAQTRGGRKRPTARP